MYIKNHVKNGEKNNYIINYNFLSITHPDPDQDVGTSPLLSNHTCPVMFCSP